jgi:hypothetical protein
MAESGSPFPRSLWIDRIVVGIILLIVSVLMMDVRNYMTSVYTEVREVKVLLIESTKRLEDRIRANELEIRRIREELSEKNRPKR